jgi:ABC-type polysaccharide/polyol phosphate export permease
MFDWKKIWALIFDLSWTEIKVRYSRSVIGPFWIVLTTAISVLGLSYIWSALFNLNKATFIPSLTVGLVIWQFLATCINEAPYCFSACNSVIRNYCFPIWVYPIVIVVKNFFIFLHNLVIIAVVLIIYPQGFGLGTLLIVPAVFLLLLVLVLIVTVFSILGARYKDLGPAVNSFMAIAFFLSPVIFRPHQLGVKEHLMWFNPFTYLITIIRDPIMGHVSQKFVYLVMVFFVLLGSVAVSYLLSRYRYRILYWI